MNTVKALLALFALVGAASVHATIYNATGSLVAWGNGIPEEVTTYPGGVPAFSGTINDTVGTFSFTFQPSFTAHINAFDGYYVADMTIEGQTLSGSFNGIVTRTTTSVSCLGSAVICGNIPSAPINGELAPALGNDPFYFYGLFNTYQTTLSGIATATYFFYAPRFDPLICYEGVSCPPPPTYAAPIPATAWLFASGLIGLTATARRRVAKSS